MQVRTNNNNIDWILVRCNSYIWSSTYVLQANLPKLLFVIKKILHIYIYISKCNSYNVYVFHIRKHCIQMNEQLNIYVKIID